MSSLRKNVIFALIANAAIAASNWVMLLFLAKKGTPEEVGLFGVSQAFALPIHMFFTFKLRSVQTTDVSSEFTNGEYKQFRSVSAIASFLVTTIAAYIVYQDRFEIAVITSIMAAGYSFLIFREYYQSVLQKGERNDQVLISNFWLGISSLILFCVFYLVSHSILVGVVGILIARAVTTLFLDSYLSRTISQNDPPPQVTNGPANVKRHLQLLRIGFPLAIVAILGSLFTSIPRIFMERVGGVEMVGFYTALSSLLVVLNLFVGSVGQSITPRLAVLYQDNIKAFYRLLGKFVTVCVIFSVIALLLVYEYSDFFLKFLLSKEYVPFGREFFNLMIAGAILMVFSIANMALNAQRTFRAQLPIYGICALIMFCASFILIPKYGINGGAYSYIICNLAGFVLCVWVFIINTRKRSYV